MQQVNLGIIGGGTVGGGVFDALKLNGGLLSSRIGVKVAVRKVAVRSLKKNRAAKNFAKFTDNRLARSRL